MAVTVPEMMKQYGYYDEGSYQPEVADLCLRAAKQYMHNAGCSEPAESDPLYELGCYMLAMHWYDNRGVAIGTVQGEIALGIHAIIHQIGD